MEKQVLIVEDELSIQKILQFEMEEAGLAVDVASDGEAGFEMACAHAYDVIILDVMLPKMDGFTVCRRLRESNVDSYIIMLSARDDEFNRILGLDSGADAYMTKPFSAREVLSKVKACLRRKNMNTKPALTQENELRHKNLTVHLDKFEVRIDGVRLELTLKEYELLVFLIKNKGRALSRDAILDALWGVSYTETRVVDVHMFKVRDKLKAHNISIKTVRGVGYLLEEEN